MPSPTHTHFSIYTLRPNFFLVITITLIHLFLAEVENPNHFVNIKIGLRLNFEKKFELRNIFYRYFI